MMLARWIGFAFLIAGWVGFILWMQPPLIVNLLLSASFGYVVMTVLQRVYR